MICDRCSPRGRRRDVADELQAERDRPSDEDGKAQDRRVAGAESGRGGRGLRLCPCTRWVGRRNRLLDSGHATAPLRKNGTVRSPSTSMVYDANLALHRLAKKLFVFPQCWSPTSTGEVALWPSPWVAVDAATMPAKRARELRDAWEEFVDGRGWRREDDGHARDPRSDRGLVARSRDAGVDPAGASTAPSVVERAACATWEQHPLAAAGPLIERACATPASPPPASSSRTPTACC